ncbi:methyltransferase domain-containing protein [Candidatus Omnitrophota bacterium]
MQKELLEILCCPDCKGELRLKVNQGQDGRIKQGSLACDCGNNFKITEYIPRFVKSDKYVDSFSFEWTKHRTTQLDSANQTLESEDRFKKSANFPLEDLKDKVVLDVGCGMGRFSEIALKYGARVIGIDLSFAVDAAFKNMGDNKNIDFVQADVFRLPFKGNSFDFIYSLGVLHHTPNPKGAFMVLPRLLKSGGKISITLYSAYEKIFVWNTKFWRFFTTRLPKKLLYYLCFLAGPLYYLYQIPVFGRALKLFFIISMQPRWRWRVLDTFDWYSPTYQFWFTHFEVFQWFKESNLNEIEVLECGISLVGGK